MKDRVDEELGLEEVIRLAMQLSPVVRVEAGQTVVASRDTFFDIQANQAGVMEALATFDTNFEADFRSRIIDQPPDAFFGPGLTEPLQRDELAPNFGWTRTTQWGARTSVLFNPDPAYLFLGDPDGTSFNPRHVGELEVSIRQPLLKGGGRAVNLAPIEISRIDVAKSDWDFKRAIMASLRGVVTAYWDLYAASVAVQAIEDVLPLLEEIVRIQNEAYKADWVTQTDVAKAETQLYEFRQNYEALRSDMLAQELRLRSLVGLPLDDGRNLIPTTSPLEHRLEIDPAQVVLAALDNQPELVRQRLNVRLRTVERVVALNGRQLQLDVFALTRRNGVGESIDDAINQMLTQDFQDWELGASLTFPLGRRQANAALRAAELELAKERNLLDQQILSLQYDLQNTLRSIEFSFRQYEQAVKRLEAAERWAKGAKLRYENPNVESPDANILVVNLNEYLNSLRIRTRAATERAELLAAYNSDLVKLEEQKGTLLDFFCVSLLGDPCRRTTNWPRPEVDLSPRDPKQQPTHEPPSKIDQTLWLDNRRLAIGRQQSSERTKNLWYPNGGVSSPSEIPLPQVHIRLPEVESPPTARFPASDQRS